MVRNRFPDFNLLPWRINKRMNLLSANGFTIGLYFEFIHEYSGEIGRRFVINGADYPVFSWEEGGACVDPDAGFRYVAWHEKDGWKKLRVRDSQPDRVELETGAGRSLVALYFLPAIGGEFPIRYSIRI